MDLKQEIKDFGKKIGLDAVGFASAEPFFREKEILRERESEGLISPFEEKNIELRCHPEKLIPGARTIICVAMGYLIKPYYPIETNLEQPEVKGKFSRYAGIKDYHDVLPNKLNSLVKFISEREKGIFKVMVDTGSLMDKAAAQRAGIGWIGENTCFFTPQLGSWIFLGEIVTDIYIEPDKPLKSFCDSCGRCVKACPTGALMAPFTIDPNRCLSYITQMRGEIPEEFKNVLGNRIFGCDTCQEACPKNHRVKIPNHREFIHAAPLEEDLIKLAKLTKKDFNKIFKPTAAGWRGRNTLRRNAICALGNTGNAKYVEQLKQLLKDPSEVVREQASWSLKNLL